MPQLVTRVDARLLREVDRLVEGGVVASRSEAVRMALGELVERRRRQAVGERIAADYRARPQTEAEVGWADAGTIAMITEEPW